MNKKALMNVLQNEKFIDNLLEGMIEEGFYIIDKPPVYSLRKCLEVADDHILDTIYLFQQNLMSKKPKKNSTKEEIINILEKEIPKSFSEFVSGLDKEDKEAVKEVLKKKKTSIECVNLITLGFMYGFKENDKTVYIIPNELLDIYKNYTNSDEKKKNDNASAIMYTMAYVLMNGVVPKKILEDILINEYELNITKEQIYEIASTHHFVYRDEYYVAFDGGEKAKEIFDKLIELKKEIPVMVLDEYQMYEYLEMLHNMIEELTKLFNDEGLINSILLKLFVIHLPIDESIERFDIPKKKSKKFEELIEKYYDSFRYWPFGGRTTEEFEIYHFISNPCFDKKPKFNDLKTCLEKLPEDIYDTIISNYDENENLEKQIIDNLKENIGFYDDLEIGEIMDLNHQEITPIIDSYLLNNGFVYLYEDNGKIKCFIPNEIMEILENEYDQNDDFYIHNLVGSYINMNGVIEKEKVKELLKDYHDIELSIKELDEIVNEIDAKILHNKYYTWIEDAGKDEIENIANKRNSSDKFKCADLDDDRLENEFKFELSIILKNELPNNPETEKIYHIIIFGTKFGIISEDYIEFIFDDLNVSVSKKTISKIYNLYKQYKKYIGVWSYNGYSVTEYNELKQTKSQKIGRNEPCPCGSGKKYKKCCGK